MVSGSRGEGEREAEGGVISGHAYTFISTHEFSHEQKLVRLLKLRNPWGTCEWTGDWSDNSPLWTAELREECGSRVADDGEFFIPYDEYFEQYAMTSIGVNVDRQHYSHSTILYDFG